LREASRGGLADYSGIDYDALDAGAAVYWPCPSPGTGGTPRLFLDRFAHPDGKARLVAVRFAPGRAADPAARGGLTLLTGRLLEHYQSGAQTRRVPELAAAQAELLAEVHPATAAGLGIEDGDRVELSNLRGRVLARARHNPEVRLDCVFLPFHYPHEASANLLTSPATDPVSSMPGFKNAPVTLRPLAPAAEGRELAGAAL
jgi:assimilatory nitrate reductase catalytic subunit